MKKNIKLLFLIFCGFFVFIFGGCNKSDVMTSITVKNNSSENPFEIYVGEMDFNQYYLVVEYSSGKINEVNITSDMIKSSEEVKFYKEGLQEIEVIYNKQSIKMYLDVNKKELEDVYLEDMNVYYTGQYYEVNVSGNLPKDAVVIYPNGNKFKNAGTYEIEALIYEDGFDVKHLTSTLVINKATYDLSGIKFTDASFVYDGKTKTIMIDGDLPVGVSVNYEYSDLAKDVGSYEVTAKFNGDFDNYEVIPDLKATITINKANYNLEGIRLEDATFVYDGNTHNLELINEDLLPEGVLAYYENNSHVNVGEYEVLVYFVGDNKNYEEIESLTAVMKIVKASYDLSNIHFESALFKQDGIPKRIEITGTLPEGVTVSYFIYSQDLETSYDKYPSTIGTYIVIARFTHNNENYLPIEDMLAMIIIER